MKVTVLSGGVGGARFLRGMSVVAEADNMTIVGNVADDVEVLGLHVSPDLDSILYGLAGLADDERGWGRADETWNALETVAGLGGESWFRLGDRDLGLHLVRTQLLREGKTLSEATASLAGSLGLRCRLLPATDEPLRTFVETPAGTFPFQRWFVARGHRDDVDAVHYAGAPEARAAPAVVESIDAADVIVITPSNPYVSIGPILAVEEVRGAIERRRVPCVAVSPLIGGRAVKGPRRPHARPDGGRHVTGSRRVVLRGAHRRARHRRGGLGRGAAVGRPHGRDGDVDARPRSPAAPGAGRARCCRCARMKVAILGGTGSFGRALATRLVAAGGHEVVIGSRDAARAQEAAAELGGGTSGATNDDAVRSVELAVLAVKAEAALETARDVALRARDDAAAVGRVRPLLLEGRGAAGPGRALARGADPGRRRGTRRRGSPLDRRVEHPQCARP
jgi:LPPG:FO 2-phospho-L-lactate transferase